MQDQHSGADERDAESQRLDACDALAERQPRYSDDRQRCERKQQDRVEGRRRPQRDVTECLKGSDASEAEQRDCNSSASR